MKKYWITALLGMALISFGQSAGQGEGPECDCPACREKAESGKEFTLPGLQGLEGDRQPDAVQDVHEDAGRQPDEAEHGAAHGHDHSAPGDEPDVHREDACCPSDAKAETGLHDHDADEVHDHVSHEGDDHGDHADEGIELSEGMIAKLGLQIQTAKGGVVSRSSTFPAEIKLNRDQTAAVSPRYPSIVRQVFAEIGDEVKKGDVLAALENRETMAVYTVMAPQDGVIIIKDLAVGETASEDKVLFEVTDLSSVWADISIFPQYQHVLKKGMPVNFVAHDGHTAQGVVKYVSPIVSHETRTFTARCVLAGVDEDFTPGAFVRARIATGQADARVVVPRDAVQTIDGESVVFIPDEHGFSATPVKTGLMDDAVVEILQGLDPNDRYVAAGAFALKAQMVTRGMDPHAGHGH
jgi:cobalt-zinc-cadmium efflux system membrane fusion protein